MEVRNNGSYGVVIAYDSENPSRRIVMSQSEAIELRDLLLREFPVPLNEHERQRLAEMNVELFSRVEKILRRERIATAVLAGFAACDEPYQPEDPCDVAVSWADALIAALDK